MGDAAFVRDQIEPGRFSDGRAHGYALGLQVGSYKGVREISHGGATAGYRTQLSLYPDQGIAVAVLCNVANANPVAAANAVADVYLAGRVTQSAPPPQQTEGGEKVPPVQPTPAQLQELVGTYVSDEAEVSMIAPRAA